MPYIWPYQAAQLSVCIVKGKKQDLTLKLKPARLLFKFTAL
ncbi:hypothetical protein RNAN_3794 [Rheinheimera nanhaiensis E407-8]|uniref:Uncharacterized protein n=1 Tax=Rheinheimera nanhaiensis E407-8 TaxID=562729 RepID=I1E385_9GAMM|nr:hypothetical protein RNAN_3794 [Rheinheimera nanhaiensis E407-8]